MRPRGAAVAVVLLLAVAGCGDGGSRTASKPLRVFAAASLTESFTTLAHDFEEQHPGTRVELNFGPSSGLAEQVRGGAPADVYAAASPDPMESLVSDGSSDEPRDFATNRLAIAVPDGNPGHVRRLEDLARTGLKVAVCQPQVPCGKVAAAVLDRAGLDVRPATEEVDVKGVLTKVELDEVDAGLVYVTDVRAAGQADTKVTGVEIPDELNESTTYPIATLSDSAQPGLARDFVDLVVSGAGRRVLARAGFGPP